MLSTIRVLEFKCFSGVRRGGAIRAIKTNRRSNPGFPIVNAIAIRNLSGRIVNLLHAFVSLSITRGLNQWVRPTDHLMQRRSRSNHGIHAVFFLDLKLDQECAT